jgi:hypothetical protein
MCNLFYFCFYVTTQLVGAVRVISACVCAIEHELTCSKTHTHAHTHTHTHTHTYTHTYVHTHIRTHTHTYGHTHAHTHTYTVWVVYLPAHRHRLNKYLSVCYIYEMCRVVHRLHLMLLLLLNCMFCSAHNQNVYFHMAIKWWHTNTHIHTCARVYVPAITYNWLQICSISLCL